jgi:hypothetical protein
MLLLQINPSAGDLIHIAEVTAMCALAFIGTKIKDAVKDVRLEQMTVKAELLRQQNEMRNAIDVRHSETRERLAVHIAEDEARFDGISRTLLRIDGKLDELGRRRAE